MVECLVCYVNPIRPIPNDRTVVGLRVETPVAVVDVVEVIRSSESTWRSNSFAARQVAAVTPRIFSRSSALERVDLMFRKYGLYEAVRVRDNLRDLMQLTSLPKIDQQYMVPTSMSQPYPLSKFLMCLALFGGDMTYANQVSLKNGVLTLVGDSRYRVLIGDVGPT